MKSIAFFRAAVLASAIILFVTIFNNGGGDTIIEIIITDARTVYLKGSSLN
jgi:hypothetical protein